MQYIYEYCNIYIMKHIFPQFSIQYIVSYEKGKVIEMQISRYPSRPGRVGSPQHEFLVSEIAIPTHLSDLFLFFLYVIFSLFIVHEGLLISAARMNASF